MSEPAENAAPEVVETASTTEAPVSGENTPEQSTVETSTEPKTFTQEEVDALIAKRLARHERKLQREQRPAQEATTTTPAKAEKPIPDNFRTTEEYIEAVADWKADQKFEQKFAEHDKSQREARGREAQKVAQAAYQKLEESARTKYDDFEDVVYADDLPITDHMLLAIQNSDVGPDVAYYLGTHREEAARIARLHPLLQAKELGKIEAKLPADDTQTATTKPAPNPIRPAGRGSSPARIIDTTDPRSTKSMSTSEWIAAERKRQETKWKAAHS